MEYSLLGFGPLALILLGFTLVWAFHSNPRANTAGLRFGTVLGWILLLVGFVLGITAATHFIALLLVPMFLVVVLAASCRYLASEKQALLWLLAVSAERGISLKSSARAFAAERSDRAGLRARLLADYLDAGAPLGLALRRSHNSLAEPALLAAEMGEATGSLGQALRRAMGHSDRQETVRESVLETLFYLVFLIGFGITVVTFMMVKIVPVMAKMFDDFSLELPIATQTLIDVSNGAVQFWPLFAPVYMLIGGLLFIAVLHYMGYSIRNFPGLRRFWYSADCAWVMRWLSIGVSRKRPIVETTRLLAGYFPQPVIRRRLERAAARIDHGVDWCTSLRKSHLIGRAESVVLQSAERVGNLEWALGEMAESRSRRALDRAQMIVSLVGPLVVALLGFAVLMITMGMILPLFSLIGGLS